MDFGALKASRWGFSNCLKGEISKEIGDDKGKRKERMNGENPVEVMGRNQREIGNNQRRRSSKSKRRKDFGRLLNALDAEKRQMTLDASEMMKEFGLD